MKTIHTTQMESFEASSLSELKEQFNSTMRWVSRTANSCEKPVVDLQSLRGYVIYETIERVPDCFKDELNIRGIKVCCPECKYYNPIDFKSGDCPYVVRGKLLSSDECCDRFFRAWESEVDWFKEGEKDKYGKAIKECGCKSLRSA